MKFKVLNWIKDEILLFLGSISEGALRTLLFFLPLGFFMLLLQFRSKVSKVSNLTIYTNDSSVWQHVFPGFILVSVDKNEVRNWIKKNMDHVQAEISKNKYLLCFLLAFIMVLFMVLMYIK